MIFEYGWEKITGKNVVKYPQNAEKWKSARRASRRLPPKTREMENLHVEPARDYLLKMENTIMENNAVIAETDRLILRRYRESDLQDLYEYLSDAEVVKFEPYQPMTPEETEKNLEWRISTEEMIAVELKSNQKMIGNVYLGKREFESLEIGYVFNKEYWGKGYAKESCEKLIASAFSAGIHRIFAECDPQNAGSWRLLEALGFEREAHLRKNVYFWKDDKNKPIWKDTYIYAKLKE